MSFALRAAHPADLPLGAQGRGADRRPRRRDVLRAFASCAPSAARCASCSTTCAGRHTVLRKELFAHRRELVLWTSWGLLLGGVNVVIVWYGGYLNIVGRASIGDIMAFQWYTFLLLNPVWNIVNSFSELQRSLAAMERVFEVLAMEDDKPDRPDARDAPRGGARDSVRERRVRVSRGPAGRARLQRHRAGRIGGRAGRPQRRRQDDGDRPGGALSRSDARAHPAQRLGHSRLPPAHLSRPAGDRAAGRVPVRRLGARQHRLRPPRRHRRRDRGRRPPRQRARVHRASCPSSTTRSSASAASSSPAASSSGWPSPGRSWRRRRS